MWCVLERRLCLSLCASPRLLLRPPLYTIGRSLGESLIMNGVRCARCKSYFSRIRVWLINGWRLVQSKYTIMILILILLIIMSIINVTIFHLMHASYERRIVYYIIHYIIYTLYYYIILLYYIHSASVSLSLTQMLLETLTCSSRFNRLGGHKGCTPD